MAAQQHRRLIRAWPKATSLRAPLFASGLTSAGGIMGLLGVAFKFYETTWNKDNPIALPHSFQYHDWVSVVAFAALAFSLYYFALKPLQK